MLSKTEGAFHAWDRFSLLGVGKYRSRHYARGGLSMSERPNIFRPIHKGIRSMLYAHARWLQVADFQDPEASNALVLGLKKDLGDSLSDCLLCLLSVHTRHEERDILAALGRHDPGAVALVMKEHVQLAHTVREVAATCDELLRATMPEDRLSLGDRLLTEADALFAEYMVHLNHEEDWVVPVMWQWFADADLDAMRGGFYNNLPLPLFETWMRWTLPALNPHELRLFVRGMAGPSPNRLGELLRIAEATLPAGRWTALKTSVSDLT